MSKLLKGGAPKFSKKGGGGYHKFTKLLKKAKSTEKVLLSLSDDYEKILKKYYAKYQQHILNLNQLDKYFTDDDYNFESFRKSFDLIFSNHKNTDLLKNPLLLSNYLGIKSKYKNDEIVEYHMAQQFKYLFNTYYSEIERLLIVQIAVRNMLTTPEFKIYASDGKETDFMPIPQVKYQLNYEKTKSILDPIINSVKSKLNLYEPTNKKNMILNPSHNPKGIQDIEYKPAFINPNLKDRKEPVILFKEIPKDVQKEIQKKTLKKNSKPIQNIKVPANEAALPVVKVDIPKKL